MSIMKSIKKTIIPVALTAAIIFPASGHIVYAKEKNDSTKETTVKETVTEEHTEVNEIEICKITFKYTKELEIFDGFLPTGETESISLNNVVELEKGGSLSSLEFDSDILAILDACDSLPDEINSSYSITAKIYADGSVSIASCTESAALSCETTVTVYETVEKEMTEVDSDVVEEEIEEDVVEDPEDEHEVELEDETHKEDAAKEETEIETESEDEVTEESSEEADNE